jgi:tetratricopeptide (TPR) repeat protein
MFYPPVDEQGNVLFPLFNLPLQILTVVNLTGDPEKKSAEFDRIKAYYSDLITAYPDSKVAMSAHGNLARLYEKTEEWAKEIDELSYVKDTTSNAYIPVQLKIADIYSMRTGNFKKALELYNNIAGRLHGDDTMLIPEVQYKIARTKMSMGDYSEARQILVNVKENYPGYFATNSVAQFAICRSFELEGNWNRAEVEYNILIENYRGTDEALSAFLYIAEHLKKVGRAEEAKRWYNDAEEHYKQLAAASPGTIYEARALTYLADLYRRGKSWPQAADTYIKISNRFPSSELGRQALLKASAVYRTQLDEPAKADSLIEVFKASIADLIGSNES